MVEVSENRLFSVCAFGSLWLHSEYEFNKTKVLLTQEGVSDSNILRMLEEGWAEPLRQLAKQLKTRTAT
jgi:hypothetical protein